MTVVSLISSAQYLKSLSAPWSQNELCKTSLSMQQQQPAEGNTVTDRWRRGWGGVGWGAEAGNLQLISDLSVASFISALHHRRRHDATHAIIPLLHIFHYGADDDAAARLTAGETRRRGGSERTRLYHQ